MADPDNHTPSDDAPRSPLDFTDPLWASPPFELSWSLAGPRHGCACQLGHADIATTTATYTAEAPEDANP
ncbi:hypothetical protein [Kitasatospora sp. NPDC058478]|uniref:hypothetical protein n=1 Tax=unclassified Kitasatospora TaxID=2633591 RepID=UPI003651F837